MNSTDIADQLRGVYRPDHWMRNRKWWWAYFIWAIGVAGVNAFKIYDALYEEEKKAKRPGLPPKWTHAEFLEELVYDFLLPGQTQKHVDLLRDIDNASFASSVRTTRSFSMYGSMPQPAEEQYNFRCIDGRKAFFNKRKACHITKDRMDGAYFAQRLDGQRHGWVHALKKHHCQYCYFVWANECDAEQKNGAFKWKKQNKDKIIRCLVCNVNLCFECDHTFHGVASPSSAS